MEIQLLPEHIIDQIKAGEVIDSPAGIVKELLENAIDAGATKIELHLVNNGLELINISDNGSGISFEDLPMAFARHATSKIETFEDLYHCHSFGFRGEALASLASVAKVTCLSATKNEPGQKIVLEGGHLLLHEKLSTIKNPGTEIFIKELFFNTPARYKFMTSQAGEKSKIKKVLNYYLISHPDIHFSIKWDDKDKNIFPVTEIQKRFRSLTKLNTEELYVVENSYEDLRVTGQFGKIEKSRPIQYCYVNRRPIEDDRIRNTINHTLQNYGFSRKNDWIICLDIPQNKIDVNVHPKKTQVKFFQSSLVYSLVSNALKHYFSTQKNIVKNSQNRFQGIQTSEQKISLESFGKNFQTNYKNDFHETSQKQEHFVGSKINFNYSSSKNHYLSNDEVLIVKNENLFWGNNLEAISKKFLKILSESQQDITPLLVSDPLTCDSLKPETINILNFLNIEVMAIEKNYWVVKSLPRCLASFDPQFLDQLIIDLNVTTDIQAVFTNNLKSNISQEMVDQFYSLELLEKISFPSIF